MMIDFQDFKKENQFQEEIVETIKNLQFSYWYQVDDNFACFILKKTPMAFVFMEYVPKGETTAKQTLDESIHNIPGQSRTSNGEWVVESVFNSSEKHMNSIFSQYKAEKNPEKPLTQFIRHAVASNP